MKRLALRSAWSVLLFASAAHAAWLPPAYIDLIRHDDIDGIQALSARAIETAESDAARHPEALCVALEDRVRLMFFLSFAAPPPPLERAIECRSQLPASAKNTARVIWLNAILAQTLGMSGDAKRSAETLKTVGPQLKSAAPQLARLDVAVAAKALATASYRSNDLAGGLQWLQSNIENANEDDLFSGIIRAKFLVQECFYLGRLGRFAEAEKVGNDAVRLISKRMGQSSAVEVDALFSLGQVQYFAQHFAAARATLERAIAMARPLSSRVAQLSLSSCLDMWASLLKHSGEYDKARAALQEAIAIHRQFAPTETGNLAAKLSNLGSVELEAGHCDAALPLMRESIALVEARSGPDSIELVPKLSNLALCEMDGADLEHARADVTREMTIATKTYGPHNGHLGVPLLDSARMELAEKNYADAEAILRKALDIMPGDLDTFIEIRVAIERSLARALYGENHDDDAFQHAVIAERLRQRLLRRFADVLDESTGLGLHSTVQGGMDLVLALATDKTAPARVEQAWQLESGSRLLITQLVAARLKAARQSGNPQIHALWQQWEIANDAYSSALRQTKGDQPASADLLALRATLESAERILATHIPGLHDAVDADFSSIRAALPPNAVLIGFASALADAWSTEHTRAFDSDPRRLFAFVLVAGAAPTLLDLGDADAASTSVRRWTAALRDPSSTLAGVTQLGDDVRQRIWEPLRIPREARKIFIVADGELHRMAWLALPIGDGMLAERGIVPYVLEDERNLLTPSVDAADVGMTLVGAVPVRNIQKGCDAALAPLPGARRELDDIRTLWDYPGHDRRVFFLTGADATKTAVLADMQKSSVVHFATHALSGDIDCAHAPLASRSLGVVAPLGAANESAVAKLLLADGADPKRGNEVLTATDIVALRLDAVKLVILAACDTGLGPVMRDEGVFGLARAFHLAGAHDVVMSLWDVNDVATADLMVRMYQAHWRGGLPVADALAGAARDLLASRRAAGQSVHPYYWAAFVADGGR